MSPALRKQIRTIALIGLAVFVLVNGCSWQPGYGGRNDRKPGMEVERYFGWPACYYCDLWQSNEPMTVEPWAFAPPFPITRKMYFVYCEFGLLPLLLDVVLVVAGIVVVVIVCVAEDPRKTKPWMAVLCAVLFLLAILIVKFGGMTSVYL
jgi:hypothetical protein